MSEKIETGGPAFPHAVEKHDNYTGANWRDSHGGMTLREYAAIKLRVPNSGTDWLDEMIRQSLRDELAGRAMQAFIRGANNVMFGVSYPDNNMIYALAAYAMADAMLKAREVKHEQG